MSTFDPAAHLHKQGWKGKGTALKQGHATRPLAVVQKKNLGGIGRDRDEAIPFWDQIFASTAASIFTPSPTPSGSSTPIPLNSAHTSTRSWTTTTFGAPTVQVKKAGTVSVAARVNKEQAKKGLYSRFFRGKVVEPDPEPEAEAEVETVVESSTTNPNINEEAEAGPSNSITDSTISVPNNDNDTESKGAKKSNGNGKGKGKERGGETKEERRARRAEKAKRKLEREERKALRAATVPTAEVQAGEAVNGDGKGRIKRKRKDEVEAEMVDGVDHTIDKKVEFKRVKVDKEPVEDVGSNEDMEPDDRKLEKKKAKKEKKEKKAKRETVD